ncbi:MAG: zinc metallopeptidase [Christensenellales bacterium]|jgi:Zn-dependent membrane protease YugP
MYLPYFIDSTWLLLIPGILLSLWAQSRINSAYKTYSQISAARGITAAETAKAILRDAGINDVSIERSPGAGLSDHYSPREKVLRLSSGVYSSSSIAALGIAAHEAGHAIQHKNGYFPIKLRNALAPVVNIGSTLAIPLLILGIALEAFELMYIGIFAFAGVVIFQLITLPLEYNASSRAMAALESGGYLNSDELHGSRKVLNAAALTYLAAALTAMLQLLRFILLARGRRRN